MTLSRIDPGEEVTLIDIEGGRGVKGLRSIQIYKIIFDKVYPFL